MKSDLKDSLFFVALSFTVACFMWVITGDRTAFWVFNIFTGIALFSSFFDWIG